ncbi:unnamed protein product [Brassicogethes aeneus]|uniref:Suppressor of cytokine signaling 6 n=1 Tax=Brassicogethes aeneus TaxID=1431903 RepID=A0A9P0AN49_BRAAE|nr:unnamed protein product [Brassicogethes aeneus]
MEKNSWISSFKNLRLRRRNSNERNDLGTENVVLRRNQPSNSNDTTTCSKTRSSFRRSFIKFQTRVKNAVSRNRSHNRHTIHVTNSPSRGNTSSSNPSSHRVTLLTPSRNKENIYSYGPLSRFSAIMPVIETPPEIPARALSPRVEPSQSRDHLESVRVPIDEIQSLASCYWYWGPLSRTEAEEKLHSMPDGAFLIRDSSSSSYLFSISFRSMGKTLHSRIEYSRGRYSLYDQEGFCNIKDLIDNAMKASSDSIYCYSKSAGLIPNYPVRLTKPISRFTTVRPLKYLCRFVIKQCTNMNDIAKLPLPPLVMDYLQEEGPYF